jgi:hypothetical protein
MQLAGEGKVDDLLDTLRGKCLQKVGGLYYFTKVVMGYKDLVPHYHLPLGNAIQASIPRRRRGWLRPRGHFKSTMMKSYPIWRTCGGGAEDVTFDPRNLRFLYVGESDTVAKKNLRDISWNIQNNQLLKVLFPQIIPIDFNKVTWKDDELEFARSKSFDEPTIKSVGVGAKTTGFHFDVLIYDDIIGEKAAKSPAEMQAAIEWFSYAAGLANDPSTVEEIIIGTRWKHGTADLYGYIMEELQFSEENGRPTGFEWDVQGCYDEEGEPLFYPRFTKEILADILKREKTYKFSCQYLNFPCPPPGSQFSEEQIKTFKIATDPQTNKRDMLVPSDGTSSVRLRDLARVSFYDPSSGGKSAECENAIVCVGTAFDNRKFAFKVWSKNCGFREAVEQWFRLNDQFSTWPNMFEAVGAHKEVKSIVDLRQGESTHCPVCLKEKGVKVKHRRLSAEPIQPPGGNAQKEDRILTFVQADIEDGLVYLDENDVKTRQQIIAFPHGNLIDRFDALAYAVHHSKRPHSPSEIEAEQVAVQTARVAKVQRTSQTFEVGGYI